MNTAAGGWAADFQRLHISQTPSPGPIPVQQFRAQAPLIKSQHAVPGTAAGAWGGEFVRQQQSLGKGKAVESEPTMDSGRLGLGYSYAPVEMGMSMGMGAYGGMQQQPQQQSQSNMLGVQDHTEQANFDDAFEEAMMEMERMQDSQEQQQQHHHQQQQQYDTQQTQPDQMMVDEAPSSLEKSSIRIGSDAIDYTETVNRTPDQDVRDADELARTAGHLLNLVQHDTSTKFQNSQFLDLMRRIRDREVEVKENDLQSTSPTPGAGRNQVEALPPQSLHQQQNENLDMRPHDPNSFAFPDLNTVFAPTDADLEAPDFDPATLQQQQPQRAPAPTGSWQTRPSSVPPAPVQIPNASDADAMYTSAADEYPSGRATTALHPGGRFYPEMSPRMSGARRVSMSEVAGRMASQERA